MRIGKYTLRNPFGTESETKGLTRGLPLSSGCPQPITPGRETEDPSDNLSLTDKYKTIEPEFALEWLPILENLAVYNQDVGYAVDNIVQLANTPYTIKFRSDVSDKVKKEITELINSEKDKWYSFSGGFNSFKSDILTQAAINGAMSTEIVPNKQLDNINLIRVAPKHIRFLYNVKTERYEPFQEVRNPQNSEAGTYGLKKLNTCKFKYIAWRRIHEGPYPVPPFLTAIRTLNIQNDIVNNISFIIKRLGMLGFLSATVEPPAKRGGESDSAYFARCLKYLEDTVYPQLQKNLSEGIVVGFKGSHEFDMNSSTTNVTGAEQLVKIVEQMLFAGLKQDPNMLGRNFSTTETFGRVILAKMTNQVKEYQVMLNSLMKEIFCLFITLRGYDPNLITEVISEPAMIADKAVEQTAKGKEIDNTIKLRDENIINQQEAANDLGYEKPASEAPDKSIQNPSEPKKETDDDSEVQENISSFELQFNKKIVEYNYNTNDCHGPISFNKNADFDNLVLNGFANNYSNDVYKPYSKFIVEAGKSSVEVIQSFNQLSPLQTIAEAVYLAILQDWEEYYASNLPSITEKHVDKTYSHYRKDTSVFPGEEGFAKSKKSFADDFVIPEPAFGLDDFRSIEYMAESDSMYLGKFITDDSTKKKVFSYLEENYINGDLPFGNDPKAIREFKNNFSQVMNFESYKIRRIIDTSVNNIRNDANVRYIQQAELLEYEVIEISDNRTCDYCNHMNGMVMKVDNAVSKINNKTSSNPDNVSLMSPFATTVKIDTFQKMDASQLQAAGFSTPSYHASCRGRIVAVI